MAPCGLYCDDCTIFKATTDEQARREVIAWLERRGRTNIVPESIGCVGCPGDGGPYWAPDCEILRCTRERGLATCNQCAEFVCERLDSWGKQYEHHRDAVERLKQLRPCVPS
jgi:hypothetical protein